MPSLKAARMPMVWVRLSYIRHMPVGVFCPGGTRPPVQTMIAFIDDHRAVYGVEPICRVVPITPSMLWNKRCLIDERLGKL
jgi:hypothetical protein